MHIHKQLAPTCLHGKSVHPQAPLTLSSAQIKCKLAKPAVHLRFADSRGSNDLSELSHGDSSAQRLVQPAERGGQPPASSQPDAFLQKRKRLRKPSTQPRSRNLKSTTQPRDPKIRGAGSGAWEGGGTVWQGGQAASLTWATAARVVGRPASRTAMSSTSGSDSTSCIGEVAGGRQRRWCFGGEKWGGG